MSDVENKKCEACGNDTFQVRDILSKEIPSIGLGQILMGVLFTCTVCKNEEYERDI
ncbi:hypothetical protein LCGC14_2218300 [marine sediment metagenome]|uniref:Methyltransferase putative zinc binding domain-containing protein n=1 Tax=marine sediment metagenome TaxID=412755 RepID=A0A0F9DBQ5_9ZZZZ